MTTSEATSLVLAHNAKVAARTRDSAEHLDYILIDGSGSMSDKWWNFLVAADSLLDDIRKTPLDPRLIVQAFDSQNIDSVQRDGALSSQAPLGQAPIVSAHFASTPLYDAINVMGRRLQVLAPKNASILIVTDGHDNMSHTSVVQAKAVLDWMKANGWQVTFLGCDFNNFSQATALGVNAQNVIGVSTANLKDAMKAFAAKRIRYGTTGQDIHFSDDERKTFGGYLEGSSK